ncbi:MAG TPA: hypothetical protein VD932_02705 [Aquabacterium sp.]|nr:hypothetical protein [Aquabacterium sp.]
MKIGVVGGGVVGHATARCFMEHGEVRVYDVVPERCTHDLDSTLDSDLVFVCLPTPAGEDGVCDTSAIDRFFAGVDGSAFCGRNFVLRSTVPVGTTRDIAARHQIPNIVHSPEFLTARCAVTDAQLPARNIIGMPYANGALVALRSLYKKRFPGVPLHVVTSDESEAVKLMQNSFFAVKIATFNEFYEFAQKRGLNWERVLSAVLADGRIAHSHTIVPGPDGLRGYGGACLPKDIANLAHCIGEDATILRAAIERNKRDRERVA